MTASDESPLLTAVSAIVKNNGLGDPLNSMPTTDFIDAPRFLYFLEDGRDDIGTVRPLDVRSRIRDIGYGPLDRRFN